MLPTSYFERLCSAHRLRTFANPRERRCGVRADIRARAHMCPIVSDKVMSPTIIRIREISQTGGSLINQTKMRAGQEFLLRIDGRDGNKYWLWNRVRRAHALDDLCNLVGFSYFRILYPGQDLRVGTHAGTLLWLDVDGKDEPEDPFNGEVRVA